jgi:predicted Zn-dependent protease
MRSVIGFFLPLALAGVLASGCQSVQTTQAGAVGIERRQSMLVSTQEMNQAASQNYRQVLQQAQQKGALNRDPATVERIRTIARRIIPHTGAFRQEAPSWQWEVNVISSKDLNAWCMPGGKIAFYTGLIDKLQLTDDEAAAIMGHEMAHALREHARERASQAMATGLGISIVGAAVGLGQGGMNLASVLTDLTFVRPNSRLHETEADRIGVELAARSGYDPRAAVSLWQKMGRASGDQPPQWLSTHPSNETRLKDLEVYAARVMPLYERARGGRR